MRPLAPAAFAAVPAPAIGVACLVGALPVAWLATRAGYGLPVHDLPRDVAMLALGSIAEEIVFRAGLQRALLRWRPTSGRAGPFSLANGLTGLVFGLAHLVHHSPLAALAVVPVSWLLGWAYERSGERLGPPCGLHVYFNLVLYGCSVLVAAGK